MYRIFLLLLATLLLVATGCDVQVKIDEEEGVDVKTPGVDVTVSAEEGVDVQAPGVDVKVSPDEGVEVRTGEGDKPTDETSPTPP